MDDGILFKRSNYYINYYTNNNVYLTEQICGARSATFNARYNFDINDDLTAVHKCVAQEYAGAKNHTLNKKKKKESKNNNK